MSLAFAKIVLNGDAHLSPEIYKYSLMTLPNFLIIGAGKAGTTSLFYYLKQHPDIYMSPVKEPQYFALGDMRLDFCGPDDDNELSRVPRDMASYCALFKGASSKTAIGEASTANLYIPRACERIQKHVPDVKLIAILRDPVERAYSNFLHQVRLGNEPFLDFAHALMAEGDRIQKKWSYRFHYQRRGLYYKQLKPYVDSFAQNQIRIYLYEDLVEDPQSLMQDIFQFVGVDDTFRLDQYPKQNPSLLPRSLLFQKFLTQPTRVKSLLRLCIPQRVRWWLAKMACNSNLHKPVLPVETRRQLIQGYREDILKLQDLIDRDLRNWLTP